MKNLGRLSLYPFEPSKTNWVQTCEAEEGWSFAAPHSLTITMFGKTAASASLHNADQVLNECCIERILSESAEHNKKMQKIDATKKHADANKLLNESISIRRNAFLQVRHIRPGSISRFDAC